jgi:hypothetical protein
MKDTSFAEVYAKCRGFGVWLLKPKGMRKYYILEKGGHRVRLARSWDEARRIVGEGLQLLFEDYEPIVDCIESTTAKVEEEETCH